MWDGERRSTTNGRWWKVFWQEDRTAHQLFYTQGNCTLCHRRSTTVHRGGGSKLLAVAVATTVNREKWRTGFYAMTLAKHTSGTVRPHLFISTSCNSYRPTSRIERTPWRELALQFCSRVGGCWTSTGYQISRDGKDTRFRALPEARQDLLARR